MVPKIFLKNPIHTSPLTTEKTFYFRVFLGNTSSNVGFNSSELLSLNYRQVVLSHEIEKNLPTLSYVCKIPLGCDICWNKLYSTELDRATFEFSPKKIGFYGI